MTPPTSTPPDDVVVTQEDINELDVFLAAYADEPDGDLVNRIELDNLLTWGILRRALHTLRFPTYQDGLRDMREQAAKVALQEEQAACDAMHSETDLTDRAYRRGRRDAAQAIWLMIHALPTEPLGGEG